MKHLVINVKSIRVNYKGKLTAVASFEDLRFRA